MFITQLSHRKVEGLVLPNGWPQFKSHHWILLRTPEDDSSLFCGDQNRPFFTGQLQLWSWRPKQVFEAKPWCFPNPDRVVSVHEPNKSMHTALWRERIRTFQPAPTSSCKIKTRSVFVICCFAETYWASICSAEWVGPIRHWLTLILSIKRFQPVTNHSPETLSVFKSGFWIFHVLS